MRIEHSIALLDADAFFVACERVADPRLGGRPAVVVADAKRRSVVLAASYEARPFGVKTGMVLHEARRACPTLTVVESHPALYLHLSSEIEKILWDFTDRVEMSSVDEAYLDLTGVLSYFHADAVTIGRRIQARITQDLGLPVTLGIGPNKLIAKLLADLAKPEGVREVRAPDVAALFEQTPVEKLCGIGSRMQAALAPLGVKTAADLGRLPVEVLLDRFGVIGWTLKHMGQGIDHSPVRSIGGRPGPTRFPGRYVADETVIPDEVKSIGHAHTLQTDTADPGIVHSFLFLLSEKVAARLRRHDLAGRVIHVTIRTADFDTLGKQRKISIPTSNGPEIYGVARGILNELWRPNPPPPAIRLVGVSVSYLSPRNAQPPLLPAERRRSDLDDLVDRINSRHGRGAIRPAAQLPAEKFGILTPPIPPHQHDSR